MKINHIIAEGVKENRGYFDGMPTSDNDYFRIPGPDARHSPYVSPSSPEPQPTKPAKYSAGDVVPVYMGSSPGVATINPSQIVKGEIIEVDPSGHMYVYKIKLEDGKIASVGDKRIDVARATLKKAGVAEGFDDVVKGVKRYVKGKPSKSERETHHANRTIGAAQAFHQTSDPTEKDYIKQQMFKHANRYYKVKNLEESDTVYPGAEVIKTKRGKPVGEIYQDASGWGCFHYKADRGADCIESKEEALEWLKDIAEEYRQDRSLREQGVAETRVGNRMSDIAVGSPKIVYKNGRAVGEIGLDHDPSPGQGPYYMKHYETNTWYSGYDTKQEALADLKHVVAQMNEGIGADTAKLGGIAALGIAGGLAGNYVDQQQPKVEIGGKIAFVEPAHSRVPDSAMTLTGKDGKTYRVWATRGTAQSPQRYHAVPVQGVKEGYPKHQDLSGISTERLQAYVKKVSGGGVPQFGAGAQLKRVQQELKRREQGVSEASDDNEYAGKEYYYFVDGRGNHLQTEICNLEQAKKYAKKFSKLYNKPVYIRDEEGEYPLGDDPIPRVYGPGQGVAEGEAPIDTDWYRKQQERQTRAKQKQGVSEGEQERKRNALWAQITSYEKRARETKNDIKKQHLLKMADELRGKLAPTTEEKLAESFDELQASVDALKGLE